MYYLSTEGNAPVSFENLNYNENYNTHTQEQYKNLFRFT